MSDPSEFELLELAVPYALDAVSDAERAEIDRRLAESPQPVVAAFRAQVAEAREALGTLSDATAVPPPAALRDAVLRSNRSQVREHRWRKAVLAAAAILAVVGSAFAAGWMLRPPPAPPVAEQVITAPDVRSVSTALRPGGTATVVYSRTRGDGMVMFDGAAPPPAGHGVPGVADEGRCSGAVGSADPGDAHGHGFGHRAGHGAGSDGRTGGTCGSYSAR